MVPVILSGGSGARLWPLSRAAFPKQFLPLIGDKSLLTLTLQRVEGLNGLQPPLVVCNDEHRFLVAEQLRVAGVDDATIVLEPSGRNTAPAVAVAALALAEQDPATVMLVLPADHLIPDHRALHETLRAAHEAAASGNLVTLGVVPSRAETGYGYIKRGAPAGDALAGADTWFRVERFVEKPDLASAERYLGSGDYFWNSGIFLFKAQRILEELDEHAPDILHSAREALRLARRDLSFTRLDSAAFVGCRGESIDYAVMEKTGHAVVVPLRTGWSDLGSWSALQQSCPPDPEGNVLLGDVLAEDTRNCYVRSEGRLVATLGLFDHVVVETADAVLVAHRDRVQDVKRIVERLKAAGRDETDFHRRVFRPWGWYEGIARAERFQVKHIQVNPGARLSLQMHHHRAEHWVVVRGTARVTCGDETRLLGEDQSTYIPLGTAHRLENPGVIPLELIEVQTGSYLGEDDIVRFDDQYGRNQQA
ncbi:MAG: mannose-1-phosphate guanylyltransferase/mannose-6-phosphate isomerase [Gammaproteobacteria bacterium]|nr:mannose-1-phosphate guanylyltransferase/mannose-6-phosphate isomerase [Gammaproteobacteria bacterium]